MNCWTLNSLLFFAAIQFFFSFVFFPFSGSSPFVILFILWYLVYEHRRSLLYKTALFSPLLDKLESQLIRVALVVPLSVLF